MASSSLGFEVALRLASPADVPFLKAVFAATRTVELSYLAENQREPFIEMQFNMQQQNYRLNYPAAENNIILCGREPIGRILVDRGPRNFVLVDIAIAEEFRNRGVGSYLIRKLMNEAGALQKPLELSVFKSNPALRLYQRLGFSLVKDDGLYLIMRWYPDTL